MDGSVQQDFHAAPIDGGAPQTVTPQGVAPAGLRAGTTVSLHLQSVLLAMAVIALGGLADSVAALVALPAADIAGFAHAAVTLLLCLQFAIGVVAHAHRVRTLGQLGLRTELRDVLSFFLMGFLLCMAGRCLNFPSVFFGLVAGYSALMALWAGRTGVSLGELDRGLKLVDEWLLIKHGLGAWVALACLVLALSPVADIPVFVASLALLGFEVLLAMFVIGDFGRLLDGRLHTPKPPNGFAARVEALMPETMAKQSTEARQWIEASRQA